MLNDGELMLWPGTYMSLAAVSCVRAAAERSFLRHPGLAQAAMSVSIYWHRKLTRTAKTAKSVRSRYPFLNFFQQRMQWKCDFYLGLRQHVGETCIQAGIEANTRAPERIKLRLLSRMKPHPTDAYRHSVEKNFSPVG
jgi:hypothetical protein